jgi:hypothetical protein
MQKSLRNDSLDINILKDDKPEIKEGTIYIRIISDLDDSDNLWDIISTTSVTEEDISVKVDNLGFDLIQEYF